jgi:GNAT superfamily N-acetyltransferase
MSDAVVRQARPDDHDDVASFTADTWPDREAEDYVPEAFPEWVASDGDSQRTAVAETDGDVVGLCRAQILTDDEAWLQGVRVAPDHRGAGHARALTENLLDWAADRGAAVARLFVFDWNATAMGHAREGGFDAVTGCRFVRVEATPAEPDVVADFEGVHALGPAWQYWTGSDARQSMDGLGLDSDVTWAVSELTRAKMAAAEPVSLVDERTRAATVRLHTRDATVADYAVAAWDEGVGPALFETIRADAAAAGADEARICVPATPRHVSGAARARAELSEATLVFATDLAGRQ